ncbi:beta-ketoacyl-[acyl-carrier-protein] synthase family protein [Chryseolinea sp. T2]|uniref:beta-ketoacyl-[acyl-carrier-protein] synthase family protein n=1 Tax=Chryseolinea sp. T2 TaxID=3129255 RepID=UPI003077A8C7
MKGRVYVAGLGVISAIGDSVAASLDSFKSHRSGISKLTLFDSVHADTLPVGQVAFSNEELADRLNVSRHLSRTALLGMHAARQAVGHANVSLKDWRAGVISATTVGGMDKTETFFPDYVRNQNSGRLRDVVDHECGKSTERIADDLNVNHYISTINTACSSSVNAIALGSRLIQHGMLDVVVAGGTDALSKFTLNGFNSLMILDQRPSRPFDASRSGLNLGEGAGFVVLVSEEVVRRAGLERKFVVSGYANTNDAYHQTASSPEGRGSFAAMTGALNMAGISKNEINYINLHGTGTVNNDLSEGTAIKRLYGDEHPPMSSTKAFTGHTLGASGGVEAVFSIMALEAGCLLPNLRFETAIPEVGITPQRVYQDGVQVNHVLSNSFGFGGNCSSIVLSKFKPE